MLDFWRGRITLRRLHVLMQQLPNHSRFWSAAAGHPRERWQQTDYLLAQAIDILAVAHLEKPERLDRPGERQARENAVTQRAQRWLERKQRREATQ